jgi:hypothetical protein
MSTEIMPFPDGVDVRIEIRDGVACVVADVPWLVARNWTAEAGRQGFPLRDALIQRLFDLGPTSARESIEQIAQALADGAKQALLRKA